MIVLDGLTSNVDMRGDIPQKGNIGLVLGPVYHRIVPETSLISIRVIPGDIFNGFHCSYLNLVNKILDLFTSFVSRCKELPSHWNCERCDEVCSKRDGKKGRNDYKIELPSGRNMTQILIYILLTNLS